MQHSDSINYSRTVALRELETDMEVAVARRHAVDTVRRQADLVARILETHIRIYR